MAPNAESSRQQLLKSLQGCSLYIPDLQTLLEHWPQYVNPGLDHVDVKYEHGLVKHICIC